MEGGFGHMQSIIVDATSTLVITLLAYICINRVKC
jgi:hypothetical protein